MTTAFNFSRLTVLMKQVGIIVATITALASAAVAVGVPMPASTAYVDAKIAPILVEIRSLKILTIGSTRDQLDTKKILLRNEQQTLEKAVKGADAVSAQAMNRRIDQIKDELSMIERKDEELRKRYDELSGKVL